MSTNAVCVQCNRVNATEGSMQHPYCKKCFKKIWNNDYDKYLFWLATEHNEGIFQNIQIKSNKRILNVGSGDDWYGTDRVDVIKRPAVTKVYDISKGLPYKNNTFDEVYCKSIFEHTENPNKFLLECKRVLKKGGVVKILTDHAPFIFHHYNRIGKKHGDYRYSGDKIDYKDCHYALYTPEHLRNHLHKANLELVKYGLVLWGDVADNISLKTRIIQKLMSIFLGRFGYPVVYAIGRKT